MDNEFKKYYEDEMSLMEQVDFQYRISEDHKASMREAFNIECERSLEASSEVDMMLAKASFAKVSSTLGLKNIYLAEKKKQERNYNFFKWTSCIAFSMALVFMLSLIWVINNREPEAKWLEMTVPNGETSDLVLADGTRLFLNSGSRVTYPTGFSGDERRIFVEGEVLAEVTRNPEQPFVVHTDNMDIRVLGTTFNLKAYDNSDCVEVFLIDGKVICDINAGNYSNSITMSPGNVVQYDRNTGDLNMTNASTNDFKSFKQSGSMHFFNITLKDIARDLERRFNTEIVIVNEKLSRTKYFALFTNGETLDQILEILNADKSMKIKEISNKIYIE